MRNKSFNNIVRTVDWIYDDGAKKQVFSTFPYTFRYMHNAIKKWTENGNKEHDLTKRSRIIAPYGKVYTYEEALELAKAGGIILPDGNINSKEFKRKR